MHQTRSTTLQQTKLQILMHRQTKKVSNILLLESYFVSCQLSVHAKLKCTSIILCINTKTVHISSIYIVSLLYYTILYYHSTMSNRIIILYILPIQANLPLKITYYTFSPCIADSSSSLTIHITPRTHPDNEEVQVEAQNNVYTLLMSEEAVTALSETLSEAFKTNVNLKNVRLGSIMVDMMLEDLSKLEYIKDLSDKWALSNIVDNALITPEFLESCQAEYVELEVVVDEESYKQLKSQAGMILGHLAYPIMFVLISEP